MSTTQITFNKKGQELNRVKVEQDGYLYDDDQIAELAKADCHQVLLVRTRKGKFSCQAKDTLHFVKMVRRSGMDYVEAVTVMP